MIEDGLAGGCVKIPFASLFPFEKGYFVDVRCGVCVRDA